MSNSTERDARMATQTLLDIAIKASQRRSDAQTSGHRAAPSASKESRSAPSPSIPAATLRPSGMGRIVTSGDSLNTRLSSEEAALAQRDSQPKGSRQSGTPERVTVIVQRPSSPKDDPKQQPEGHAEIPVPPSAFAPLRGAGNSARSSADLSPFHSSGTPVKEHSGDDAGTQSAEQLEGRDSKRPTKRQKLARSVSINTILQKVGSREEPLKDVAGSAPQTVHDIVASPASGKALGQGPNKGDAPQRGGSQIGSDIAQPADPGLPPRKSSEQSTLEVHKQIALQDSSNTVETVLKAGAEAGTLSRALSVERDLHRGKSAAGPLGKASESAALTSPSQHAQKAIAPAKDTEEAQKLVMWTGKVKHRLKTAEGASTVDLFNVSALVPEELMEQMPPTLFVSALAGRSNVKLGKHVVAQCSLGDLEERQSQKVKALAVMRLVAICELQHCTLTLVPFTDSQQGLRIVGFMIADD